MANTDVGYLLHSRPYRDSSVIADFFLRYHGRISLLYKGVRKAGKQGAKGRLLQPFSPLAVSFDGRHELKTGRVLESAGPSTFLVGVQLYSGLYLNELLVRLLHRDEAADALYQFYESALMALKGGGIEVALRRFEHQLLSELGYELTLTWDVNGQPVMPEQLYLYEPDHGFSPVAPISPARQSGTLSSRCFMGQHLLAMEQHAYDDQAVAQSAKRLSRLALAPHLGDKPLHSRELFKSLTHP